LKKKKSWPDGDEWWHRRFAFAAVLLCHRIRHPSRWPSETGNLFFLFLILRINLFAAPLK
jgi:hypothetical protein